jgi:chaperonin cofactor prefoldin
MEMEKLQEQVQALRLAIQSLQQDQWDCGYDDRRVQRISELRAMLNKLLGE